ncbi:hypothetical protein TRFO_41272 [Tritrichomonas foetus]|uniref:Uncharacterized protein n=1 Tax=Tritrichomonas foetus TaxID=1144522 RepID=A0A1J4L0W4_9EUKA|nr:hypothetical protein TRFO_41272 [Tritrichomonas foetus]|eukprot:OHT17161.1 hypothetical protein TRFO_41272 [Tritrichomonas foetus]
MDLFPAFIGISSSSEPKKTIKPTRTRKATGDKKVHHYQENMNPNYITYGISKAEFVSEDSSENSLLGTKYGKPGNSSQALNDNISSDHDSTHKKSKISHEKSDNSSTDATYEEIRLENAKLKAKLAQNKEERRQFEKIINENKILHHKNLRLKFEIERLKTQNAPIPRINQYMDQELFEKLKVQNLEQQNLIAQYENNRKLVMEEKEILIEKINKYKNMYKQIASSSSQLIDENERLQNLVNKGNIKIQKKNEIIQKLNEEANTKSNGNNVDNNNECVPNINHDILQQLSNELKNVEQKSQEIHSRNEILFNENKQLKEKISLYQQLDSKLDMENTQLKEQIQLLLNEKQQMLSIQDQLSE